MQSIRFLVFFLSCMLVFTVLLYCGPTRSSLRTQDARRSQSVGTYFNWRTPSSLFPPSAIISLTDDNSTFFLARPAAFGPDVPEKSLSGQLWIGSGFGDDHIGRSGPGGRLEGELGCSDVPGWRDSDGPASIVDTSSDMRSPSAVGTTPSKHNAAVKVARGGNPRKPAHADIQSLQESAEIAGKVALLSRGGCGFLDKVEWAQRRGAVAVIVGDDIRGGALVTMFARGDTSNVSIPALFTSHTTAHLLSSLMPSGRQRVVSSKSATRLGFALGGATGSKSKVETIESSATLVDTRKSTVGRDDDNASDADQNEEQSTGWFWTLFGTDSTTSSLGEDRPDDWVLQTDFDEREPIVSSEAGSESRSSVPKTRNGKPIDGFVIGVHDWRDSDLIVGPRKDSIAKRSAKDNKRTSKQVKAGTQSSGKGSKSSSSSSDKTTPSKKDNSKSSTSGRITTSDKNKPQGWFDRIVHGQRKPTSSRPDAHFIDPAQPISNPAHLHDIHMPGAAYNTPSEHDGLWVTLTPTSMSSSPFFDTLLVLVVSPLVTLTIVYALLLLRSRIRRRRWRAPKSVVERLPVRTYQTMASSPVSSVSSSISTPASMHTPLLSSVARPIAHRPRSRTGADVLSSSASNMQSLDTVEEKREAGLAEWRRKYGGKQRECVVCLEEYVDGISRVMSLPCGHEFHEGCITPWLTTRRRTCPICKGDVVRSLARSAGSSSSAFMNHDLREEEDEDEVQEQALLRTNDDPSSQRPISRGSEEFEDLERGYAGSVDRDR